MAKGEITYNIQNEQFLLLPQCFQLYSLSNISILSFMEILNHYLLWPCFSINNMSWRNLVEGHPWNISTKWFENRLHTFVGEIFQTWFWSNRNGLKEFDRRNISIKLFKNWPTSFATYFSCYIDPKQLKEFRKDHREDASYEVSSQSAKWLWRRSSLNQKFKQACMAGFITISPVVTGGEVV